MTMTETVQTSNARIGFARDAARQILRDSSNESAPISLSKVIRELSKYAPVSVKGMDFDQLDGINIRVGDKTNILYNKNHHIHRNRFTVAHEIGHLVLGHLKKTYDIADFTSSDPEEKEANEFAAELLIPTHLLKDLYKKDPSPKSLAVRFLVSEQAMFEKVMTCGLLKAPKSKSIWG
jgi:Zn-dependent peptidase ImmA (M78 family)